MVNLRNSDDWNPDPRERGVIGKIKVTLWDQWYPRAIEHPKLVCSWNRCFKFFFGTAYYHYRKFYYFGFFCQFLSIIWNQPNYAILGLISAIFGFISDKWSHPVRIRVIATFLAKGAIEEREKESFSGFPQI